MPKERRFPNDEVRKVFELATLPEVDALPLRSEMDGLTLAGMQDVGREVGLEPSVVARAAAALETRTPMRALQFNLMAFGAAADPGTETSSR